MNFEIVTDIDTDLFYRMIKELRKNNWFLSAEYDPEIFDKAIDFDFYILEKNGKQIFFIWDNWNEGEIKSDPETLKILSVQFGFSLSKGNNSHFEDELSIKKLNPLIKTYNKSTMKQNIFYVGSFLIFTSFIACVYSFYLLIFGIPVFLIGCLLVFISNKKIVKKILFTVVPLILYIPSTILFLFLYNYSKPKNILIPSDFSGQLKVIYEEACGSKYEKVDGLKTLNFPENGVLILNEKFDSHVNFKYFLIDKFGNKTEIPSIENPLDNSVKQPYITVGKSGVSYHSIEANTANKPDKGITYSEFYVYNDSSATNELHPEQTLDSITLILVNSCRNNLQ